MNENGFTMIEALITLTIISVVFAGMASLSYQVQNQINRSGRRYNLTVVQRNLISIINDKGSWEQTIKNAVTAAAGSNGGSLACLDSTNPRPCTDNGTSTGTPTANQPLNLYDAAGTLIANSSDPNFGFTEAGKPCAAGEVFGSGKCHFRYNLRWSANCPSGATCTNPQITVTGELQVSPAVKDEFNLNSANYAVPTIYRPAH